MRNKEGGQKLGERGRLQERKLSSLEGDKVVDECRGVDEKHLNSSW